MKGWFQQGFFPMQGELQVRLQGHDEHHYIKELYPEPIMERAFDGPPNMPGNRGAGRARGNRASGGGGGGRAAAPPPMDPLGSPYDGGLGLAAMYGMMPGAMQSPGMNPFFPGMRGMMPGMMPGAMGGMGMPAMAGAMGAASGRFQGRIKSFNQQKGFGFIECPEAHQVYGRDVFLHKAQIAEFEIGRLVTFSVEMNKNQMPQARDLVEADPLGFGGAFGVPNMGMSTGGGKGGYNNTKGSGKGGKGRGRGGRGDGNKDGRGGQKKSGGGDKKSAGGGGGGGGGKQAPAPGPGPGPAPEG